MTPVSIDQDLESEKNREEELSSLVADLHSHLAWRAATGCSRVSPPGPAPVPAPQVEIEAPAVESAAPGAAKMVSPRFDDLLPPQAAAAADPATLVSIRTEMGDCQGCKLASSRKNLVFGVGNPNAELVFVGEGPGADEDQAGEPFVGKAGQLLDKMIAAMRYRREDVYICNVVKCRPPGNRDPEPEEVAACAPFLKAQLSAIRPKVIVGLGRFAVQCLLGDPSARITKVRGQWARYGETDLMPTFHPAYLLRNDSAKKDAWADLKAVMTRLGRPIK